LRDPQSRYDIYSNGNKGDQCEEDKRISAWLHDVKVSRVGGALLSPQEVRFHQRREVELADRSQLTEVYERLKAGSVFWIFSPEAKALTSTYGANKSGKNLVNTSRAKGKEGRFLRQFYHHG